MITDVHVHITPWEMLRPSILDMMRRTQPNFELSLEVCKDPDRFLEMLDDAGVQRAGLINYISPDLMGFTEEVNDWVAEYCKRSPERLIPFGSVHPRFTKDPEKEMERVVNGLGIRAIKIHPPHQLMHANEYADGLETLRVIYATAERLGAVVMIHTGTSIFPGARNKFADPMDVDDVAIDFPNLKLIIAHGGRPLYCEKAFFLVRRHKNVYLEVSGIPPSRLLHYFPRLEEIAGKTLYGSDWPAPMVPGIKQNLEGFNQLPISAEAKRKILVENPAKLFPVPGK